MKSLSKMAFGFLLCLSFTALGMGYIRPKPKPQPQPQPVYDVVIKVYDSDTTRDDLRVGGAKVTFNGETVLSDDFGFVLFKVKKGTYDLTIEAEDFAPFTTSVAIDRTHNADDPANPNGAFRFPIHRVCNKVPENKFAACYYDSSDFTALRANREESQINFDWGEGSPASTIESDTFSARWSGIFNFEAETYEFNVTSDDGSRLYVDNELVLDLWGDHNVIRKTIEKVLPAGPHKVVLEYYENGGGAVAKLSWNKKGKYLKRAGRVRIESNSLADDGGKFNALGASLFWAPWGYKFEREKLEQNLAFLAKNGFDYIRVFGQVGCTGALPNGSSGPLCPDGHRNWWDGRVISHQWPDYEEVIAAVTDLAYDKYGLRVEWSIFATGDAMPKSEHTKILDKFLKMSQGREHKIMYFEIGNESFWTGLGEWNDAGISYHRQLTKYMNDRTDIPVAATSPPGEPDVCENSRILNQGVSNISTIHYDRTDWEGGWRTVRLTWDNCPAGVEATSSDEPVGPGSSVVSIHDPYLLVSAAINAYVSKVGMYVYHTEAGVWGGLFTDEGGHASPGTGKSDVWEYPVSSMYRNINKFLPPGLASWNRLNVTWGGYPFELSGPDTYFGNFHRAYASTNGNDFVVFPIGLKGEINMKAKSNMEVEAYDIMTGEVIAARSLNVGETITINHPPAFFVKGKFR